MEDYVENYKIFETALNDAKAISVKYAGIPAPTSSHYYASLIFTKLSVSGETIINNCPSPSELGCGKHWDFASVSSLTRGLIEAYLLFHYLCIEKCNDKVWEGRWRLMNLHDHMSRLKMFSALKDSDEALKFEKGTADVKADLIKTDYFKSLSERKQKHFLKGNNAFFLSKDEIVESYNGNVDDFRFAYRFLSNHTHTFPMGFYRMVQGNRGCGVETETEVHYTSLCLSWAAQYLKLANDGYSNKWAESVK